VYGSPDGRYGRRLAFVPPEKRFGFDYWKACECTHEYNQSLYYEGNDRTPKYWPGYDAFAQTDDACSFIRQQSKAADPFCLVLSLGPPHFPLETAPEPYRKRYEGREIALRENVPANLREKSAEMHRGYYAHMAAVDECLDRLLKTVGDDTIVVFTSDHGDMMLSQGLTTKQYPWDESIRVPFLLRYPEKYGRKGQRIRTPLNSPDILPTLLSLAEIPIPDSVEGTAGGGPAALLTLPIPATETRRYGIAEYRGLRNERYTYVRSIRGPWLLYDNHSDPYQKHNLIGNAAGRSAQAQMERILSTELKRRNDDFLPAAEWVKRAGVGHYREVNVPVGRHVSPWGDWESTLPQA
jgi:arylsulfatase A-like enzyme